MHLSLPFWQTSEGRADYRAWSSDSSYLSQSVVNRLGRSFKNLILLPRALTDSVLLPTWLMAVRADCGRYFASGLRAKAESQFGHCCLQKARHVLVFLGCLQCFSLQSGRGASPFQCLSLVRCITLLPSTCLELSK